MTLGQGSIATPHHASQSRIHINAAIDVPLWEIGKPGILFRPKSEIRKTIIDIKNTHPIRMLSAGDKGNKRKALYTNGLTGPYCANISLCISNPFEIPMICANIYPSWW